jgi:hypothetical protein
MSSRLFQNPTARPARYAAPSAVVSVTKRAYDGNAEDVRLELHEQIVRCRSAINAQFEDVDGTLFLYGVDDVSDLVGDAFQRGACDVPGGCATGQADYRSPGVLIPVRCAEAGEGGYKVDAGVVVDRKCQPFDIVYRSHDAQSVPQPLHDDAAHEQAAFERVLGTPVYLPPDRRQQLMSRDGRCRAGVQEYEAAGAVGALGQPRRQAQLPEERRLLIFGDARDRSCERRGG